MSNNGWGQGGQAGGNSADVSKLKTISFSELILLTPEIGDMYFLSNENTAVLFTSNGWKTLEMKNLYYIAFFTDFETGLDGFIFKNDPINYWIRGSANAGYGTYYMCISNNGESSAYNHNHASVSHAYIDVVIPSNISELKLEFRWHGEGESGYDYGRVYIAPTTFTPVVGSLPPNSYRVGKSQYNNISYNNWQYEGLDLPLSHAGTTIRLIFSFKNDSNTGWNPGFGIDNVKVGFKPL